MAMKLLSEGAEAKVYETSFAGLPALVKARLPKGYRIREIDEQIRASRTKAEARILAAATAAGVPAPRVFHVERYEIYIEMIDGRRLSDWIDASGAELWITIGASLAALHAADIAHGDYTPANILVDGKGGHCVIDFGLAEITNSNEAKALDVLLMKRAIGKAQLDGFLKGYVKGYKDSGKVLARLAEIERRGRYQARSLA